ncbi:hypothetical protein D3C75_1100360 [compost metagenome]
MPLDAFDPRLELDLCRAQVALIIKLHRLFAGCECQANQAQCTQALLDTLGHQAAARPGQGFQVIDDQRRIHQHLAIVEHQGRRLDHRVDLLELLEGPEHRHRLLLQGDAQALGRNGNASNVR